MPKERAEQFHSLCIYNCWKRFRESFAEDDIDSKDARYNGANEAG